MNYHVIRARQEHALEMKVKQFLRNKTREGECWEVDTFQRLTVPYGMNLKPWVATLVELYEDDD